MFLPPGYIVALSDRAVQLIFVLILYFGAVSCLERIHPGHLQKWGYSSLGLDKIYEYMANGYLPFRDIIFTYNDEDGAIDLMEVDRILRGFGVIE